MNKLIKDIDSEEVTRMIECSACLGEGYFDVGDPEDGVSEDCELCGGCGEIEDIDGVDVFVAERDAWDMGD